MKIPIFTPKRQYEILKEEIDKVIFSVLESGIFILGENVKNFEKEVANYLGARFAIGVSSGTSALLISLKAFNLKKDDLVITTPFTFFATAEEIINAGGTPIFADIEEEDFSLSSEKTEDVLKKYKGKIKVILPVHLFGKCVNMEDFLFLAKKYGVHIVEDAAQIIGSICKVNGRNKKGGTIGDFGAFSFFPTKNLGAYGDGGLIVTNNEELYEMANMIRSHGSKKRYYHEIIGTNSRLDEIQAAVLRIKLKYLDSFNKKRVEIAKYYNDKIKALNLPIKVPHVPNDGSHIFHQYVIKTERRDELSKFLNEHGVGNAIYYPVPLHFQKALLYLGYKPGDFPVAEKVSKEVIALPIFPELKKKELDYVIEVLEKFYRG